MIEAIFLACMATSSPQKPVDPPIDRTGLRGLTIVLKEPLKKKINRYNVKYYYGTL